MPSSPIASLALSIVLAGCFNKTVGVIYLGTGGALLTGGIIAEASEPTCPPADELCESDEPEGPMMIMGGVILALIGFASILSDPRVYAKPKPKPPAAPAR